MFTMTKSFIIWLIAILLLVYAGYNTWIISVTNNYWFLLWVGSCVAASSGLIMSKAWSQYFVYLVAFFTAGGWAFVTINIALNGWPYSDTQNTIISLVPGAALFLTCVFISVYVFKYFKNQNAKT